MFQGSYDGELVLQPEEVDDVYLMSLEEIFQRKNEFTPDGIHALNVYVERCNFKSA